MGGDGAPRCHGGEQGNTESADRQAAGIAASPTGAAGTAADEAAAVLGSAAGTYSLVDLSISAAGLVSLDVTSASDPICVVYEVGPRGLVELGRTEVVCTWGGGCRGWGVHTRRAPMPPFRVGDVVCVGRRL